MFPEPSEISKEYRIREHELFILFVNAWRVWRVGRIYECVRGNGEELESRVFKVP